ncbi:hypothetical protein C468_14143, partial [Halorubrum kocurii JCM 14978]
MDMTTLNNLQDRYRTFVAERDWNQFHTPKNLAEAISIEANELLEVFLWHDNHEPEEVQKDPELKSRIEEELADVVIYSIAIATQLDIDIVDAVEKKMDALMKYIVGESENCLDNLFQRLSTRF